MKLSYWFVVLSVVLPQAIFSEALDRGHYNYGAHPSRLPAGGVNGAQRWPSFQQSPWSLYPRAPYRPNSQLYPRWPNTNPHNLHVRWPNSRPSTPTRTTTSTSTTTTTPTTTTTIRPQVSNHRRVNRLRSLPNVDPKSGSLESTLQLRQPNQGWRTRKQWILPRNYFTSARRSGGSTTRTRTRPRGGHQTCNNGKVWRGGACVCPFLSNWDSVKNECVCVYGTYRHFSGHCHSY